MMEMLNAFFVDLVWYRNSPNHIIGFSLEWSSMVKILKLADPIISTYNGYALSLSIILNSQVGFEWFIQNYNNIITVYTEEYKEIFMDFVNVTDIFVNSFEIYQPDNFMCRPLRTYSLPRSFVQDNEIIQFVKKQIDDDYYICTFINRKYIKQHNIEFDFTHDILICGYDDERELIYVCDYFNQEKYTLSTCPYSELVKAYKYANSYMEDENNVFYEHTDVGRINLLKLNDLYNDTFNINNFADSLRYYLNPQMYSMDYKIWIYKIKKESGAKKCFGIDNYKVIINFLKYQIMNNNYIDIRQLHLFYEHKRAYAVKMKFLVENGYCNDYSFTDDAAKLAKNAAILRNMSMMHNERKYTNITQNSTKDLINRLEHYLNDMYEIEIKLVTRLLEYI